jgi:hypothetical protein
MHFLVRDIGNKEVAGKIFRNKDSGGIFGDGSSLGGRVGGKSKTIGSFHRSKQPALYIDPVGATARGVKMTCRTEERLRGELHMVAEEPKP